MPLKAALAAALFVAIVVGFTLPSKPPRAAAQPKSQIAQINIHPY